MQLTQKETMLLQDLKTQEQVCVTKYEEYAARAQDAQLRQLFTEIGRQEQTHLDTVNQMLTGTVPMMTGGSGGQQQSASAQPKQASVSPEEQQADNYLCQDALGTEKHVSGTYDTCIFEFGDAGARDALNHIQKEEQQHGKRIYDYMAANGMSA